jgi:CBS domain containing-hemolysin-like protein
VTEPVFWIILPLLVLLDLLVTLVRASLVNARLPYLVNLQETHPVGAAWALKLLETPRVRASLRLGVALMHFLLAGAIGWWLLVSIQTSLSLGQALGIAAGLALLIVLLEFSVEGLILRDLEQWTIRLAPIARFLDWILIPFTWLLMILWGSVGSLQGRKANEIEDELRNWVEVGQPAGSLEKDERRMIYSIFQFSETLCREIMIPRIDVVALDVSTSIAEAVDVVIRTGHSRLPVYEDSIDNILGLLYAKDLFKAKDPHQPLDRGLLRPAYFVPEAKKADELLAEMQTRRIHLAIVVDEYGGMAGLVTLEDIVEEIVGEIRDEYDQAEELLYQQIGPDEFQFDGRTDLDDLNELLNTHLETEAADTLSGYIAAEIGRMPVSGDRVLADEWILTVEQVTGRRIRRVSARRLRPETSNEEKKDDPKR